MVGIRGRGEMIESFAQRRTGSRGMRKIGLLKNVLSGKRKAFIKAKNPTLKICRFQN